MKLTIINDAVSYFEHIKFYVENLMKGVFPLWDPFWFYGAPNDFFLRRIGAYNPFYSIIIFLQCIGIPYANAYLWFMAFYYWGGMIAFYLLAKQIYKDKLIAYAGYLILLFSALGTRIFDAYMMIITVPLIWFFYFLVSFSQKPSKHVFLGCCLSLMILLTTYIPFYFLCFFALFIILYGIIFSQHLVGVFRNYFNFFKSNIILVLMSLSIVLLSLVPLFVFYHDSASGQIVMPIRHGGAAAASTLAVGKQTLDWGIVEDLVFSLFHSDLRMYKFAIVYVPFFSIIVFCLGLWGRITKRAVLIFLCIFVGVAIFLPHGLPFYDALYSHLSFLKYFRNLHFFLWFVFIPLFVLLVLEHWKMFVIKNTVQKRKSVLLYVVFIHISAFIFVISRGDVIVSTYIMIFLSLMFWWMVVMGLIKQNGWSYLLLTMVVVTQPLEVYYYLSLRSDKPFKKYVSYRSIFTGINLKDADPSISLLHHKGGGKLYYSSGAYDFLFNNIDSYALGKYLKYKLYLVDYVEKTQEQSLDLGRMEDNFLNNKNIAYVFLPQDKVIRTVGTDPNPPKNPQVLDHQNSEFKVMSFDANHLSMSIKIPYEKFLIYNDTFDPRWKCTLGGKKVDLYQVNVGYKGLWLKEGLNIVEFRYGRAWEFLLNNLLLFGAYAFLFGILWYSFKFWRTGKVQ